ncbi:MULTISPECIES: GNAT family N-acetyltransferase [unclassified Brevibacterium]|uniref:GNAT family N-acetyltransferase n=1 Tax=unclassified Brevibacterium TaxID=2614124 RepID=UPI0010C773C5|nr:GNAT family N-acetyltransferase [Brevibacterium sp. CS2]QCP05978.1 GNAT family N-acetyltransferase [Brevibacterium sp. CS2]
MPEPVAESAVRRAAPADAVVKHFSELTSEELYGILQLRSEVFVVEQDCVFLDLDGVDLYPDTLHAFIPHAGAPTPFRDSHGEQTGLSVMPAAYARLLPHGLVDGPAGHPDGRSIGRVVTDPAARSTGAGRAVVGRLVEDFAGSLLTLNAQSYLERFYAGFGFERSGEDFLEDGIVHIPMRRAARPARG